MNYDIHLDVYSGPMDLLLDLIKKNKINIYDIPIAFLADEFVKEMEKNSISLELMADFLVMAATLLEIKSKMLLPKKIEEEEEDPRLDLVQKIIEYQKFQEVAQELKLRHQVELGTYYRKQEEFISPDDVKFLEEGNLTELTKVLHGLLQKVVEKSQDILQPLRPEYFPVAKSIEKIRYAFLEQEKILFSQLLSENPSKEEIISFFLGTLELSKFHEMYIEIHGGKDLLLRRRRNE